MVAMRAEGETFMTAASMVERDAPPKPFAPQHKWDRNFFLAVVALIWLGILMGFGGDILDHVRLHKPAYPLVVHIHAAAYVGWLVLLTAQIWLIRSRNIALHRRLGVLGAPWLGVMVVLGLAVTYVVDRQAYRLPHPHPQFMSIQLMSLLDIVLLVGGGLWLRKLSSAHKRLILLGTLSIASAGFSRWLGGPISQALGDGFWATFAALYVGNDLLILAIGAYDLVTRRRLHPAYAAGAAWIFVSQLIAVWLFFSPWWRTVAVKLIGY
jgi:hypothetical protein